MRSLIIATIAVGLPAATIRFTYRPLPVVLDHGETARKYAPESMAGGVALFDFDNDGNPDLYFANGAEMPALQKTSPKYWNRLLRGDGKGAFADVTEKAGVAGTGYDTGIAIGDYDNDGFADIFVGGVHRNTLYHNNRNGTFTDVTAKAGLAKPGTESLWSVGGVWVDLNKDGLLDLFVVNYLAWSAAKEPECLYEGKPDYCHPRYYKGTPNSLYLNRGDGTFADVSEQYGLTRHVGKGMGVAMADYDGDGYPDLFVSNDTLFNFLFRNVGGKKFEEVALEAGVALAEHGDFISGMGVDFRDMDNDGRPDIVYVALDNQTFPLLRNTGKGFREITFASGMTVASRPMAGYSPGFYDLDNDGWKDLFVTRGHVQSLNMKGRMNVEQPNSAFRNLRNGQFAVDEKTGLESGPALRHRGSAWGDLNHDGAIDIVVTALGAKAELWLNAGAAGAHWLEVKLEGTRSNRDGIGAVVKVVSKSGTQYNHATHAVGYASSSAGPVHFGLGTDTTADVEVRWPAGTVQRLTGVAVDRVLAVKEPK
jgi:enediyne biosynthesis protein E4